MGPLKRRGISSARYTIFKGLRVKEEESEDRVRLSFVWMVT